MRRIYINSFCNKETRVGAAQKLARSLSSSLKGKQLESDCQASNWSHVGFRLTINSLSM